MAHQLATTAAAVVDGSDRTMGESGRSRKKEEEEDDDDDDSKCVCAVQAYGVRESFASLSSLFVCQFDLDYF